MGFIKRLAACAAFAVLSLPGLNGVARADSRPFTGFSEIPAAIFKSGRSTIALPAKTSSSAKKSNSAKFFLPLPSKKGKLQAECEPNNDLLSPFFSAEETGDTGTTDVTRAFTKAVPYKCSIKGKSKKNFVRFVTSGGKFAGGMMQYGGIHELVPLAEVEGVRKVSKARARKYRIKNPKGGFAVAEIKNSELDKIGSNCGAGASAHDHAGEYLQDLAHMANGVQVAAASSANARLLELAVMADYRYTQDVSDAKTFIQRVINEVDGLYRANLNIQVSLVKYKAYTSKGTDPFKEFDPQGNSLRAEDLLDKFMSFSAGSSPFGTTPYDVAHLFTGRDTTSPLANNIVGIAKIGGACTANKYGLSENYDSSKAAVLAAHEIGHNLGAQHDSCGSGDRLIMCPNIVSSMQFSPASKSTISNFVATRGGCMSNVTLDIGFAKDTEFSPVSGYRGGTLSIYGDNLQLVEQVKIGSTTLDRSFFVLTASSPMRLQVKIPQTMNIGSGKVALFGPGLPSAGKKSKTNFVVKAEENPSKPLNLKAASTPDGSAVTLTWNYGDSVLSSMTTFVIERKAAGVSGFSQIAVSPLNGYTDRNITSSGKPYTYRVKASVKFPAVTKESPYSDTAETDSGGGTGPTPTPAAESQPPAAVSDLKAANITHNSAAFTWTDNSAPGSANNEESFIVYRGEMSDIVGRATVFNVIASLPSGTIRFSDGGLKSLQSYTYQIEAKNSAGVSSRVSVNIRTTAAPDANPPVAPAGLSVSQITTTGLKLSWTDNSSNETGFRIYRRTPSTAFSAAIGSVGVNVNSFTDSGLSSGTEYVYKVQAFNANGSADSGELKVKTDTPAPVLSAPASLTAVQYSSTAANLSWAHAGRDANTSYEIEREIYGQGFKLVGVTAGLQATDAALTSGVTYRYRVRAKRQGSYSEYSNMVILALKQDSPAPPAAPSGVTAAVSGDTAVTVSWSKPSGAVACEVERSVANQSAFTRISTTTGSTYIDTSASRGSTLYYRVRCYSSSSSGSTAYSGYTNAPSVTVPSGPQAPSAAPSGLSIASVTSGSLVLRWIDNSYNESAFQIFRKAGSGSFIQIATVSANQTLYSDSGLTPNTVYTYYVRAYNAQGARDSGSVSATTTGGPESPALPTDLRADNHARFAVILTWADNSTNETGFVIERNSQVVTTVGANVTSYIDTNLSWNTPYTYRIRAIRGDWTSDYSNTATISPFISGSGAPAAPTNLTALPDAKGVKLAWTDNSGFQGIFNIERRVAGTALFTTIAGSGGTNSNQYVDAGAVSGVKYDYRVRLYKVNEPNAVFSAYTNVASVTFTAPVPRPYQNPGAKKEDVNGDGIVNQQDVDSLVSYLNTYGVGTLPRPGAPAAGSLYVDVNGDGILSPADLLIVIETIARTAPGKITGFSPSSASAGQTVRIQGTGFSNVVNIYINGKAATPLGYAADKTWIDIRVPPGATTGAVVVRTHGGDIVGSGLTIQ